MLRLLTTLLLGLATLAVAQSAADPPVDNPPAGVSASNGSPPAAHPPTGPSLPDASDAWPTASESHRTPTGDGPLISGDASSPSAATGRDIDSPRAVDPQVLQDIARIRGRRGSIVAGTSLEDPAEDAEQAGAAFLRVLGRVARGTADSANQLAAPEGGRRGHSAVTGVETLLDHADESESTLMDPLARSLLQLSGRIDQRAAVLDLRQQADQADRLRRLARRMRREARRLSPPGPATPGMTIDR